MFPVKWIFIEKIFNGNFTRCLLSIYPIRFIRSKNKYLFLLKLEYKVRAVLLLNFFIYLDNFK